MLEQWKDIKGYERYEVSNLGRVRSKEMTRINHRFQQGKYQEFPCYYPSKILKPDKYNAGNSIYLRVTLSKDNKTERFSVHRLVAEAFVANPENKPFVNHKDNNASNNCATNLEWVTHSENMEWAQKQHRLYDAQSKGGKAGSATNRLKMFNQIEKLKNTYVNDWLVLGDAKEFSKGKWKVLCECKCGTRNWIDLYRLNPKNKNCVTCCSHCYKRLRKKGKDIV